MPTNDERCEVAARLRELDGWETETLSDTWYVEQLSKIVGYSDTGSMTERLADLIEPTLETCELELTCGGQTNAHVRTYECSCCGKSCDSVWGEDYEFCPYCGRRIEYADE